MREIKCLNCGKLVLDQTWAQNKKFCSKRCASGFNHRKGHYQANDTPCLYNDGVVCMDHKCDNCGWNPAVAKMREEKIYG